jgi:hypothetical protein
VEAVGAEGRLLPHGLRDEKQRDISWWWNGGEIVVEVGEVGVRFGDWAAVGKKRA